MPGSVDIPIIQPLPVTVGPRGAVVRVARVPVRFSWDLVLLGSAAMHHSVRSPVTHRATHVHTRGHAHVHIWTRMVNRHTRTYTHITAINVCAHAGHSDGKTGSNRYMARSERRI